MGMKCGLLIVLVWVNSAYCESYSVLKDSLKLAGVGFVFLTDENYKAVPMKVVRDFKPKLGVMFDPGYDCDDVAGEVYTQFKRKHGCNKAFWKLAVEAKRGDGHALNVFLCKEDDRFYVVDYEFWKLVLLTEYLKDKKESYVFGI